MIRRRFRRLRRERKNNKYSGISGIYALGISVKKIRDTVFIMRNDRTKNGFTLTEMVVSVGVIALLVAVGVPAVNALLESFEAAEGTRSMINSAFVSAKAIAAKYQRYAGVRFQKAYSPAGPEKAPQYMIFIIQDPYLILCRFVA